VARRRVTLLDVAQRAGVSQTTASFVLTGRQDMRISEPVKERVLRVAQELEYRPNLAARSLRTRSTQTIGLISDTIATEQFAGEMISGALAAAAKHGFLLVVGESEDNPEVEASLITGMLDRGVDGLIYGTMFTRQAEVPDSAGQSPLVLLNCLATPLPAPAVIPDEHEAGRTAARALVEAGHRDGIWLVGERPAKLFAARERSRGIRAELAASGAAVAGTVDCGWSPWLAYDAMSALLRRGERPAACICMNDRTAMGRLPGRAGGRAGHPRRGLGGELRRLRPGVVAAPAAHLGRAAPLRDGFPGHGAAGHRGAARPQAPDPDAAGGALLDRAAPLNRAKPSALPG
jgi:LacI family transcriptional regulator